MWRCSKVCGAWLLIFNGRWPEMKCRLFKREMAHAAPIPSKPHSMITEFSDLIGHMFNFL